MKNCNIILCLFLFLTIILNFGKNTHEINMIILTILVYSSFLSH